MSNKKSSSLVPTLRFPEFREAGEWVEKKISEFAKITTGNKDTQNKVDNGEFPFFVRSQTVERINSYSFDGEAILTAGDGVGVGKVFHYITGKFDFHQRVYCIYNFKKDISGKYFYLYFSTHFYRRVMQLSAKNSVDSVRMFMIADMPIMLPSIKEQQKIAACLSSLDELITAHSQKLDALKKHKKGLMQQLFPAEGETVPTLRFPEFRDAGEWVEKKLGEISDIKTGPFGSVLHESDYVEVGTPIITVEHLGEIGIKGDNAPKVSDSDKTRLSSYVLSKGDIVFSRVGSVDRCAIIRDAEEGWLFSGRLLRLRLTTEKYSPSFLNQLLKHEPTKVKIRNSAVGQTMPSLNTEILKQISLFFPTLPEQQKIAACLSSLDELITAHSQKLDALKKHKKGLMQQLFPAVEK